MTKKAPDQRPARAPLNIPAAPLTVEIDLTETEAAWRRCEPRARALDAASVSLARVDVTQAAAIAIAGARNVIEQREALARAFHDPPFAVFERVRDVALAAQHADLLHRAAQDEAAPYADLLGRINELRSLLLDDMDIQVRRKRVPAKVLDGLRAGDNTVRDKANDLNDAAAYYRAHWSELSTKTTVTADEVAEAGKLATTALARMGALAVADSSKADDLSTGELRRRAFTLLDDDYDVVRRYGAFLFWTLPDGWEAYVPSLWSGRSTGASAEPAPSPAPTPPTPAKPA